METVKANILGISEPLLQLVQEAIDRALGARQGGASFTAFAISQPADRPGHLIVLATETAEEAIATARLLVAKVAPQYFVLAYDGFITDEGAGVPRTEAVHLEAYERGVGHGVRFAQRYAPADGQAPARRIGNPMYGGTLPLPTEAEYGPVVARYERERQQSGEASGQ